MHPIALSRRGFLTGSATTIGILVAAELVPARAINVSPSTGPFECGPHVAAARLMTDGTVAFVYFDQRDGYSYAVAKDGPTFTLDSNRVRLPDGVVPSHVGEVDGVPVLLGVQEEVYDEVTFTDSIDHLGPIARSMLPPTDVLQGEQSIARMALRPWAATVRGESLEEYALPTVPSDWVSAVPMAMLWMPKGLQILYRHSDQSVETIPATVSSVNESGQVQSVFRDMSVDHASFFVGPQEAFVAASFADSVERPGSLAIFDGGSWNEEDLLLSQVLTGAAGESSVSILGSESEGGDLIRSDYSEGRSNLASAPPQSLKPDVVLRPLNGAKSPAWVFLRDDGKIERVS